MGGCFMKKVKVRIPRELRDGIPLTIRPGHTVRLEITQEPLTVYTGLSLFYAMAEALGIPRSLDKHVHWLTGSRYSIRAATKFRSPWTMSIGTRADLFMCSLLKRRVSRLLSSKYIGPHQRSQDPVSMRA